MPTDTDTGDRRGDILGAIILFGGTALLIAIVYGGFFYFKPMLDEDARRDWAAWRENCIKSGGTITEYRGGFTEAKCEGMKRP